MAKANKRRCGRSTHEDLKDKVRTAGEESRNPRRKRRVENGIDRLNEEPTLSDMTRVLKEDIWFRRNRSKVYAYLVPLLSLFYFIPSIQVWSV